MSSSTHYDTIIIGTGAGGGTLAYKSALSSKRILLLERGGYLNAFHPGIHYYVGENTRFYEAALLRFRKHDFEEVKHHGGISPAWPIEYEKAVIGKPRG